MELLLPLTVRVAYFDPFILQFSSNEWLETVDNQHLKGASRLLLCFSLASRWLYPCHREPRHNLPIVGHSEHFPVHGCAEGPNGSYQGPQIHIWRQIHGHGRACRLCPHLRRAIRLLQKSRDRPLWWDCGNCLQSWYRVSLCRDSRQDLWQLARVQQEALQQILGFDDLVKRIQVRW